MDLVESKRQLFVPPVQKLDLLELIIYSWTDSKGREREREGRERERERGGKVRKGKRRDDFKQGIYVIKQELRHVSS